MNRKIRGYLNYDHRVSPVYAEPHNWEDRTYHVGIRNIDLLRHSNDDFPHPGWRGTVDLNGTHPLFLLERVGNWGLRLIPCSSSEGNGVQANAATCAYIRKGTRLMRTGKRMQKNTFLLHQYQVTLDVDSPVAGRENFFGVVPENGIEGQRYRRAPADEL